MHEMLIREAHRGGLMRYFKVAKTLNVLHEHFYWPKMKMNMQRIYHRFLTYRQVKSKVLSHGLYTLLPVPMKAWVDISMDFVVKLSGSKRCRDFIFVVVDRFSKIAHFISYYKIDDATNIANLFFIEIARFYGVPRSIFFFNYDVKFLNYFSKVLWDKLETKLLFYITYHPQIDNQTGLVNRTLTKLLRTISFKRI
jgi:hypothetical protein